MSDNRIPSALRGLLAMAVISAALDPKNSSNMPPELRAMLDEIGAPCDCPACTPNESGLKPAAEGRAETKELPPTVTEISPAVATLVGLGTPGFDADTPEGHARALAGGFISRVRALGDIPEPSFERAGVKLAGMRYAESQMLAALQTFVQLVKEAP